MFAATSLRRIMLGMLSLATYQCVFAVTVSPSRVTLNEGGTQQFTASTPSSWSATCGTITSSGLLTASLYPGSGCTVVAKATNGSGSSTASFNVVSPITITPATATTAPGGTQQLTASMPVTWSASCGKITSGGLYTATGPVGTPCTITGVSTGSVKYTVLGSVTAAYTPLTMTPSTASIKEGATQQFTTSTAATFTASCGSITAAGLYTAPFVPTSCTITATATDGSGHTLSTTVAITSPITVTPASAATAVGQTQQFTASSAVIWSSSCGSITTGGLFTASATAGSACTITATASSGTAYTTSVVDTLAAAPTLTIAPLAPSLTEGATQQFTTNAAATFAATCGTITAAGLYTAPLVPGACTVTASPTYGGGASASTTATISSPITITPASAATLQGQTQQFTASSAVKWAASCGSITSGGLFTATAAAGSACTITATASSGKAYTTSAVDTIGTAPAVVITPSAPTLTEGAVQPFTANVIVTWTTNCGSIGANTGSYTAPLTPGACTVTATPTYGGGAAATTTATINSPITITPASAATLEGLTQQFTASTAVNWTATCGSITTGGLFTASAAAGSPCKVIATASSGTAYTAIAVDTVGVPPILTIAPLAPALTEGATQQFTVNAAATFTATCGTISATGLYTAPLVPTSCTITASRTYGAANTASTIAAISSPITISPGSVSTPQGLTQQFTASAPVSWAASCGSITAGGLYTASSAVGTPCRITATAASGTAYTVSVVDTIGTPPLAISPLSAALSEGGTKQFTANASVTWSASCGSISTAGLYTAPLTAGTCTITAQNSTGSVSATATVASPITITPASAITGLGQTQQFTANMPVSWASSCGTINASGLFTATSAVGSACQVTATAATGTAYTGSVADTTGPAPVLTITPVSPSLTEGASQQFTTNAVATFTASCGTISATGLYTAPLTPVSCTVTASPVYGGGAPAAATAKTSSPLTITPAAATTGQGQMQQFTASGPVTWTSSCGLINASGLFTASSAPGSLCQITATATTGVAYTNSVVDTTGPAPVLTISPLGPTIAEGATQQFTANAAATFASSCGTISAAGLYTAPLVPGACTVTASPIYGGGAPAATTATINSPLTITPASATTPAGLTQQFTASGPVSWASSCGSINASGLFTASAAPGSLCQVTATATTGTAYTANVVDTIGLAPALVISPLNPTIPEGTTQPFTSNVPATWSSSCGTIDPNAGSYTAPLVPESCTVTATPIYGGGAPASTSATISSPITITPASAATAEGLTQQFTASVPVSWAASCGTITTGGIFTATVAAGSACTITATASSGTAFTASAVDTIAAPPTLVIAPLSPSVAEGAVQQFTANVPATWTASCGTIDPNAGTYTAPLVPESCTVTATPIYGGGAPASTTATVASPIAITPASATTGEGTTQQFTASTAVTWASSCGTINATTGLYTASANAGAVCQITATAATGVPYTGSALDTTGPAPPIVISPQSPTIGEGAGQQFTANVVATWTASCGTIDPNAGTYTAPLSPGSCIITATATDGGGVTSTTATIPSPLVITPATATTGQGQTQQFNANAAVTWSSSCGTINANGLFIASAAQGAVCTVTATAASGTAYTATALDTIGVAPTFTLSPLSPTLSENATQQFTADQVSTFAASCGTIDPNLGLYTAPLAAGSCTVTATPLYTSALPVSTTVTVTSPLTVTPAVVTTPAELTQQFTSNLPAVWQASCGSISSTGLFTASASAVGSVCTITATASSGPAYTGTAAATIGPVPPLAITPTTPSLTEGAGLQFSSSIPATFAATCGAIDPNAGAYTAPLAAGNCTITVTAADGSGNTGSTVATVTSPVLITPATATTIQNQTQQFTANVPVQWSASCGSIDPNLGLYTAPSQAGSICRITATATGGIAYTGVAVDTINPEPVLTLSPLNPSLNQAGTQQFTTNIAATYTATCGTIDPNAGLYTAPLVSGLCTVSASATDGSGQVISTTATVTSPLVVSPLSAATAQNLKQQFTANLPATWTASCGSIDPNAGVFTASATPGSVCTVTATASGSPAYTASVTDTIGAPLVLVIQPLSPALSEGSTQQFTANEPVIWTASCGSIDPNAGVYTAPLAAASCTITATATDGSGNVGSAIASISSPIAITPASATTPQGQTQQFTTSGAVSWASSCGLVNASGLYTASGAPGSLCQITATAATGPAYTASVLDTTGPAPAVVISPLSPSISEGASQTFTANVAATWTSTCGTIDPNAGTYTAPLVAEACTVTATATYGGSSASATVTVTSPIILSPASATTPQGATQQFTANVPVTWTASCGSITAAGLFTANGTVGASCTITATAGSGTAYTATGSDVIGAAFAIAPLSPSVTEGATQQFTATAPVTAWSATCGSISAAGLYTAPLVPGTCTVSATGTGSLSASTTATVVSPIAITPASASIYQGLTQQFTASAAVTWSTSCGAISSGGLFSSSSLQGVTCSITATAATGPAYTAVASVTVSSLPTSQGTTYYVDSVGGLDTNNGLSPNTAWKTIAKLNKSTFSPGSSILFDRGDTWNELFTIPSAGTSGNPITVGAYGTGAAPLIDGSNVFANWTTEAGTGYFYTPYTTAPNAAWLDANMLTQVSAKTSLATGTWWLDTTDLRIYIYDNPSGHVITASQRSYCIYSNQNYNTVQDLACIKAELTGIQLNGTNAIVQRTTVSQMILNDNTGKGYGISIHGNNGLMQYNTVYNVGWGIQVVASPGQSVSGVVAQYNTVYNIGGDGISAYSTGTGVLQNTLLQYNLVYNASQYGATLGTAGGVAFTTPLTTGQAHSGNVIQYNLTYGNGNATNSGCGIHVDPGMLNASVLYNVTYNNFGYGIGIFSTGNTTVENNTFFNDVGGPHPVSEVQINGAGGASSTTFKNNIIYTSANKLALKIPAGGTAGQILDYNDWYGGSTTPFSWSGTSYSFAAYQSLSGQDAHSITTNPQFVSASTTSPNLTLTAASPAIGTGLNLDPQNLGLSAASNWPTGVALLSEDASGLGWEMGAYVFTPQVAQVSSVQASRAGEVASVAQPRQEEACPSTTFSIYPLVTYLPVSGEQKFEARTCGVPDTNPLAFTVDKIPGGDSAVGTITREGIYTAPLSGDGPHRITVTDLALEASGASAFSSDGIAYPVAAATADFDGRSGSELRVPAGIFGAMHSTLGSGVVSQGSTVSHVNAEIPAVYATTTPDWTRIDPVLASIQASGQTAILQISMSPPWLEAACGENSAPSSIDAWAKIAASYVAHIDANFRGVVSDYEIWNEPDASGMCGVKDSLATYQTLYAAAAASMKAQAAADGATIHIGGPALSQYSAKWFETLLTNPAVATYLDFVSYHQYFGGQESLPTQWNALYETMQNSATGAAAWYGQTAQTLKSMNLRIPIYVTESGSAEADAPIFTDLSVTDLLDQAYQGYPVPGKILFSAGDSSDELIARTLGLEQGGFMARSITPQAGDGGVAATAFYTAEGDSIVLVNPTAQSYDAFPVEFLNSGLSHPTATLYQIVNGSGMTSAPLTLHGSTAKINIPPYSVQAVHLAGH